LFSSSNPKAEDDDEHEKNENRIFLSARLD
jgi:hypothetical protein